MRKETPGVPETGVAAVSQGLPSSDPVLEKCMDVARYFLDKDYETVPLECVTWVAKRIRRGIEDDLEDLERDGHIVKEKVPF